MVRLVVLLAVLVAITVILHWWFPPKPETDADWGDRQW